MLDPLHKDHKVILVLQDHKVQQVQDLKDIKVL
jgi:hypothetical protein